MNTPPYSTHQASGPSLGIIGNGNMAMAIVSGLIKVGFPANNIWISGPHIEKLNSQQAQFGISVTTSNTQFLDNTDTLILAVKPNVIPHICEEITTYLDATQKLPLIISVAAGIKTTQIQKWLKKECAIIRAMPNTPASYQEGAIGLFANAFTLEKYKEEATELLSSIGLIQWIEDENQMDIVTALSGSGPAYFFYMMEAMVEAAIALGLNPHTAKSLTVQTALGASIMAKNSAQNISTLRENVTSKGGTTEAGLSVLLDHNLKNIFKETITKAYLRGQELSHKQD